ncbi:Similar to SULT1C4: Sulfotransferase 1C4 (Homo sapiens) [Cotesia congregata]|uniref:Similar to SULT1C4: Sulfotransferase 1C4 (Homo sapiens) n=1 Tax=Cotesia congregata TaxID=51543 RepID=A0A8J2H9K5_COTCN|nr:Similar to SULT1C4: Sulfotransferase 1C4 (Homo sapiens) [Cotesia congregata]
MSSLPKYKLLDKEKTKEMLEKFTGERTGWVQVGEKKWFFPHRYIEQQEGFYNFKARLDDTWVITYPRSGTTWTQELVWLLKKQELCKKITIPGYEVLNGMPSPRFIKSHFPLSLLPGILDVGCKIIYVARNPKDVAVSWYHLNQAIKTQGYNGNFEEFWNYFQDDLTPWSPYWEHLKEAWAQRHHPNLFFIFYEEMQQNFFQTAYKVAEFLGKSYSEKEMCKLSDYLNIKNFRNNPMVNSSELRDCHIIADGGFVRNGQSGVWSNTFSPKLEAKADAWIKKNLQDTDLVFPYFNNNNISQLIN